MPIEYKVLDETQRQHFLEHGWVRIENALNPEIMDKWLEDFWIRLGWDPNDRSTWVHEDVAMPRHREAPNEIVFPKAWQAMQELAGGIDRIHPVRERYQGDQFIFNAGSANLNQEDPIPPQKLKGWHTDNDWYRQFLDSSGNMLTVICLYTDILPGGGGTWVAEDGLAGVVKYLYDRPAGIEWPYEREKIYTHIPDCKKFFQVEGKKGDVFILHGHLPHCVGKNYIRMPRIITNPHCNGKDPYNFNREDPSDYSLVEQVILRALGRESIPEWKATRERKIWYPRNYQLKGSRIPAELERMIAAKGGDASKVDSIHLHATPEEMRAHLARNGLNQPYGPDPWFPDTRVPGEWDTKPQEQMFMGSGTKHSPDGRTPPS